MCSSDLASLLELLADPASLSASDPDPEPPGQENPEHAWLRGQLQRLDPAARALLEGRLLQGCSWPELARRAGISTATARRRVLLLLRQLRQAAQEWRGAEPGQKSDPGMGWGPRQRAGRAQGLRAR